MMNDYQKQIANFYRVTENAARLFWLLDQCQAIHYGYWDERVKSFDQSLLRMNEVMAETAVIKPSDVVLDAGCGVGGSSIFLAKTYGCKVTGVTLSERQKILACRNAEKAGVAHLAEFKVMDYCQTEFNDASFDIVWGCESVCYAESKEQFVREVARVLRKGGRLVVADGFFTNTDHNQEPIMRSWLDGWLVKSLESPERFSRLMQDAGFSDIVFRDITASIMRSAKRISRFYYPAKLNHLFHRLTFRDVPELHIKNVEACRYQLIGLQKKLWLYGLVGGIKQ